MQCSAGSRRDPKDFKKLADDVSGRFQEGMPEVKWLYSFATLSRFDVIDIVESPDVRQVDLEEQMDFQRNPRVFRAWRVERLKIRGFGKVGSKDKSSGWNRRPGRPEYTRKSHS